MSSAHLISLAQHALPMRSTIWHIKLTWGIFMAAMVDQTADALILSSHLICLHTDFFRENNKRRCLVLSVHGKLGCTWELPYPMLLYPLLS